MNTDYGQNAWISLGSMRLGTNDPPFDSITNGNTTNSCDRFTEYSECLIGGV